MIEVSQIEKGLDFLGYIPVISSYSGYLRVLAAKVQIALGAAGLLGICVCKAYCHAGFGHMTPDSLKNIKQLRDYSIDNLTQGMANFARGYVEMCAWIGNILLLGYDYSIDHWFERRKIFAIPTDTSSGRPVFNEDIVQNAMSHAKQAVNTAKTTVNYAYQSVRDQLQAWQAPSPARRSDEDLPEVFSS